MLEIPDWKRRADLLSYFWARVNEEGFYKSDDPNIEWVISSDSPEAIPALSWFEDQ